MPFKKRNKKQQKTCTKQNKIIKKRLMQISICVDNYIYKHKPISIEEAKMYAQEISLYKTQCTGDVHILQVIEKLTRCMKRIVEETTRNLTTNQNITKSDKGGVEVFLESPLNIQLIDTTMIENASKYIASDDIKTTQAVVNCVNENKTNGANDATLNKKKQNDDLDKTITKYSTDDGILENNNDTISTFDNINCILNPLIANHVLDIDNSNMTNTEKPLEVFETPISSLNKDHIRSDCKEVPDTQQFKLDQAKSNVSVSTDPMQYKHDLKATMFLEKLNEINNSAQVKPAPKKKKKCVAKKRCIKEKITNKSRRSKIIPENNTNTSKMPTKFKHTNIHIRNDKVSFSAGNKNRSKKRMSQISDSFTYKYAVNDLSWVKNIEYVRELSANEFDPKLNGLDDKFWSNFSIPGSWSDIDFLY